jgi:hypothetical protein
MLFISSLPEIRFAVANKASHMFHPWLRAAAVKGSYDGSVFALATKIRLKAWIEVGSQSVRIPLSNLPLSSLSIIKLEIAKQLLANEEAEGKTKTSLPVVIYGSYSLHDLNSWVNITGFKTERSPYQAFAQALNLDEK